MKASIKVVLTGLIWGAFAVTYADLHGWIGAELPIVSLALVAATAWLWGLIPGLVAGVAIVVLDTTAMSQLVSAADGLPADNRIFEQLSHVAIGGGVG